MEQAKATITRVAAIRKYFFTPEDKTADIMRQIKELSVEEKDELGRGAAKALGMEIQEAA